MPCNFSPYSDSVSLRLHDSYRLTSLHVITRRLILQKARHHHLTVALTACGSMVSGSLSLPSRGSFHLSLTVLCAIGSCRVFSLGGWSPQIPTGFLVSRRTQVRISLPSSFRLRGFHPLCLTVPDHSANLSLSSTLSMRPTTPLISLLKVWALPTSLAATMGISFDFFSCWYLDGSLPSVFP